MNTIEVCVRRIELLAPDIRLFELAAVDGGVLPAAEPGAHVDVHIREGTVRQYSLCDGPGQGRSYQLAIKREPASRGGSAAMHDNVRVGDVLRISHPRNNFPLSQAAAHYVLIAGGIGITPILSMARHLVSSGASFELHYFVRSVACAAFHEELSGPDFRATVRFHTPLDPHGIKDELQAALGTVRPGAELYLCGPRPFMQLVQDTAAALAWPDSAVHLEYFSAGMQALGAPSGEFRLRLASTGDEYVVPDGKSIVQTLAEHGVNIDTSCEQGVCGSCLTGVLEGEPDHRDSFLTDDEKRACDRLLPCVSRARSAVLVLDI